MLRYKRFTSSKEFEQWQLENVVDMYQLIPTTLHLSTNEIHDDSSAEATTYAETGLFVVYELVKDRGNKHEKGTEATTAKTG